MYKAGVIKVLRLSKGLTQSQLAKKMGISQQAYSKLERKGWFDRPKADIIIGILNIRPNEVEIIRNAFFKEAKKI